MFHTFYWFLALNVAVSDILAFLYYSFYEIVFIIIIIIELTHSKTILENPVEIEPQLVALDFKSLSQSSSRSK